MTPEIIVAIIGAVATILTAWLGRKNEEERPEKEKQKAKETARRRPPNASGVEPTVVPVPTPRSNLVFVSILALGIALTSLAIGVWPRSLASGPPGPPGADGAPGPVGPAGPPSAIGADLLPIGTVISFSGSSDSLPNNWLLCDGAQKNPKDLPRLYAAIGTTWGGTKDVYFNLPDLRGVFLRGVDSGKNADPDAAKRLARSPGGNSGDAVGSFQDWATGIPRKSFETDEQGLHKHNFPSFADSNHLWAKGRGDEGNFVVVNAKRETEPAGPHKHSIAGGGDSETRPPNVAVIYAIRAL